MVSVLAHIPFWENTAYFSAPILCIFLAHAVVFISSFSVSHSPSVPCMSYLAVMGLLWEAGLGESCDRAEPVDPAEPTEPELPTEVLLPRCTTLFLWLAGLTVTMRLWLLATIMSVTWDDTKRILKHWKDLFNVPMFPIWNILPGWCWNSQENSNRTEALHMLLWPNSCLYF